MTISCFLRFVIKIRGWSVRVLVVVDVLCHLPHLRERVLMLSEYFHCVIYLTYKCFLPHLHYIVLGDRADDPGFSWVPREVGDLGGVPAVDEQQLGRS